MPTHSPNNERIKRRYVSYLKEARGLGEASIDQVEKALHRYESYTGFRDFGAFHIEQVKGFKQNLAEQRNLRTNDALSHATIYSTLNALKAFFMWLAGQPGFRSSFSFGDWEYFSPSGTTVSIAKAHRTTPAATLGQIRHVLTKMPNHTELERRDRAVIAFIILTGARDRAVASFRMRHIDIGQRNVVQDARVVKTKFRKTFTTWFFPVGQDIEQIVVDWVNFLRVVKLWGLDAPLFPSTHVGLSSSGQFAPLGLDQNPWSDATGIRRIFRRAFQEADLPYFKPHSFRNTLVGLGRDVCKTWPQMQAWAQNLGHESLTTTFGSYGKVASHEQGDLVRNAGKSEPSDAKIDQLISMVALITPDKAKARDKNPA